MRRRFNLNITAAGASSYVATHYVAPFALVAGASNDYAVLDATSWANAANSGTPTTLGTAMARAVAGNKVQVAPGAYIGQAWNLGSSASTHRYTGCFQPAGSGSAGNPIVFFAQYPAASHYGSTSLYSQLSRPNPTFGATDTASPLLLAPLGSQHIVFDGFYANEAVTRPGAVSGLFSLYLASNIEYRRMAVDRDATLAYPAGGNFGMFFFNNSANCRLRDSYIQGRPNTTSDNDSSVELYDMSGLVIENNTFVNAYWPLYAKTFTSGTQTPIIRYNKFLDCVYGPENQENQTYTLHNNLIVVRDAGCVFENDASAASLVSSYNNTIVLYGTATPGGDRAGYSFRSGVNHDGSNYTDNLIYIRSGASSSLRFVERAASTYTGFADITFDRNHYFDAGGSPTWTNDGTTYSTLAAWRAATGADAASTEGNPLFVNEGSGDYRLQAGSPARAGVGARTTTAGCYITGNEEIGVRVNPTY